MPEGLRQKAISGAKWRILATYSEQAIQATAGVILPWLLDPTDYGLMAAAMVVVSLIRGCTSLGMNYAIVQRRDRVEEAVNTGFVLLLAASVLSYLVLIVAGPFSAAYKADATLVWILGLLFFFRPLGIVTEGIFYRDFHFRRLFVVEFLSIALSTVLAVVLATVLPKGKGYWALAVSGLTREALRSVTGWLFSPIRPRLRFNAAMARELLHYNKYLWAAAVVMVLYSNVERLALMQLLPLGALGLYHFASTWVSQIGTVSETIFGSVAISVYAKLQDDVPRLRVSFCRIVGYSALLSTGLLAGMAILAPEGVALAFPDRWLPAVPTLQVLGLFYIVRAIDTSTGQLYVAVGKPKYNLHLGAVNLVVMAATVVPFILWQGVAGAAMSLLVARLVTMACNAVVLGRVLRCPVRRFARIVVPPLKATAVMALVLYGGLVGAYHLLGGVGWLALGGLVVAGGVAYAAALFAFERPLFWDMVGLIRDALRGEKVKANELVP